MKKLASIIVFVFAVTFTLQAQKKGERKTKFTAEQQTILAVKKMTLALDLTEKQQNQVKPILMAKMVERKAAIEKRKAAKKERKRPTADEMFVRQNKMLDKKILMKNKMKNILNKEQFEKFEKMHTKRNKMATHKRKGKKSAKRDHKMEKGK